MNLNLTFDLGIIALWFSHQQCSGFAVQGVCWVWISEELGKEDFKDVDHVVHWGPRLVNHIEANRSGTKSMLMIDRHYRAWSPAVQLVDIGMKNSVDETDAGALVWILIGQFHMDFP